jgi:hypothetical protein
VSSRHSCLIDLIDFPSSLLQMLDMLLTSIDEVERDVGVETRRWQP